MLPISTLILQENKQHIIIIIVRDVQKGDFQTLDQIMTIANGFRRYGTPP